MPVSAVDTDETLWKLPPLMNTFESSVLSDASAIASFIVFVTPGFTLAVQVSTTVRPSISVLNEPADGVGVVPVERRVHRCGATGATDVAAVDRVDRHPLGRTEPGTVAQLTPLTKNPNTSSNSVFAYSLYSSEEKT